MSDENKKAPVSDANGQFKTLQDQYYQSWFRYHPEDAVDVGVYDYADKLRSYDHDDIGALISLNKKMQSAMEEIHFSALSDDYQSDFLLIKGAIRIELHEFNSRDWRFRDPMVYVPVAAIYQLLIHPGDNFHQSVKHRLALIPDYLRGARFMLLESPQTVVPGWLSTAVVMCESGADFIRGLCRNNLMVSQFTHPDRLQPLLDDAASALLGFASFLRDEIEPLAQGDFAIGEADFNRLLKSHHALDVSAQEILTVGESLYETTEQELKQFTQAIRGNENVQAWLDDIHSQHPDAVSLLDEYRQRMLQAQKCVLKQDIVTVPDKQSLRVQETPAFLRDVIPFAAYEPPMPQDEEQLGLYYVTTVDEEALLQEHNYFSIALTSAHEAFPGHHLQFVIANQNFGHNIPRLLNASATMYEGWALYCEDLCLEQGMLNKDEHRFIMLRDRLWRILRIIIDVKLQTGQLSLSEASDLMVEKLGFDKQQADAEVSWYSSSPTIPLCYAIGRECILQLRKQCVSPDNKEELKKFHDQLLSQGSIALPLVIKQVFGEQQWQSVYAAIFEKND